MTMPMIFEWNGNFTPLTVVDIGNLNPWFVMCGKLDTNAENNIELLFSTHVSHMNGRSYS